MRALARWTFWLFALSVLSFSAVAQEPVTLSIAVVDNPDTARMRALSEEFTRAHPDIRLEWSTLEEGVLRQRVATDVATGSGLFDIVAIGTYEAPIWAGRGWLVSLDDLPASWDVDDLLPPVRQALSHRGRLYAAPFYGESSFTMYRTDLMDRVGLVMPAAPSWNFILQAAHAINELDDGVHGICLRGKPGWGENIALITAMSLAYGARWFDMDWNPQFDHAAWQRTIRDYLRLTRNYGPDGAEKFGYTDLLQLFQEGRCGIWIDATVAASAVTDPQASQVAGRVGFALAPDMGLGRRSNWLWAWALAIPVSSHHQQAARQFVAWATSAEYAQLVGDREGWLAAPPGTRRSLYDNEHYLDAARFAPLVLESILSADLENPTVQKVPYTGVQYVAIPAFAGIGTAVGGRFAAAVQGQIDGERALRDAQWVTRKVMERARVIEDE